MKLNNIIDNIIRSVDGLVRTDDSKISERALEAKIPQWKQQALLIVYNGSKTSKANVFLGAQNYYPVTYNYDPSIQISGADFTLFDIEPPVQLADDMNGCVFVGDRDTGTNFTQLKYPSTYNVGRDAGLISVDEVYYSITGTRAKIWGNTQVKTLFMDYIPVDVMNISTFNPETDEYPASQDVLDLIFKLAFAELAGQNAKPADVLNNSADREGAQLG